MLISAGQNTFYFFQLVKTHFIFVTVIVVISEAHNSTMELASVARQYNLVYLFTSGTFPFLWGILITHNFDL